MDLVLPNPLVSFPGRDLGLAPARQRAHHLRAWPAVRVIIYGQLQRLPVHKSMR